MEVGGVVSSTACPPPPPSPARFVFVRPATVIFSSAFPRPEPSQEEENELNQDPLAPSLFSWKGSRSRRSSLAQIDGCCVEISDGRDSIAAEQRWRASGLENRRRFCYRGDETGLPTTAETLNAPPKNPRARARIERSGRRSVLSLLRMGAESKRVRIRVCVKSKVSG